MVKKYNNKITSLLFFLIVTLSPFGSTKPMLRQIKNKFGCSRKDSDSNLLVPKFTNTELLPEDCVNTIFQFVDLPLLLLLKFVCKNFKKIVEKIPWNQTVRFNFQNKQNIDFDFNEFCKFSILTLANCDFSSSIIVLPNKLESLSLKKCKNFDLKTLEKPEENAELARNFANLHTLKVAGCIDFTGIGLEYLKNLQILEVKNCGEFRGPKLDNLDKLEQLNISDCGKFNFEDYPKLQKRIQEMKVNRFTEASKWNVLSNLDNLKKLTVGSGACPKTPRSQVEALKAVRKVKKNGCQFIYSKKNTH